MDKFQPGDLVKFGIQEHSTLTNYSKHSTFYIHKIFLGQICSIDELFNESEDKFSVQYFKTDNRTRYGLNLYQPDNKNQPTDNIGRICDINQYDNKMDKAEYKDGIINDTGNKGCCVVKNINRVIEENDETKICVEQYYIINKKFLVATTIPYEHIIEFSDPNDRYFLLENDIIL